MKVDNRQVVARIYRSRRLDREVTDRLNARFIAAKRKMLTEYEDNKVTKELRGGNDEENLSGTLVGGRKDAVKNLFTYIGFYEAESPADDLRDIIESNTTFYPNPRKISGVKLAFRYKVTLPEDEIIRSKTQMHWSSQSWAEGVDSGSGNSGISGVGHYLTTLLSEMRRFPNSHSGFGIQVDEDLKSQPKFQPVPYLSKIFSNFVKYITE